MNIIKHRNVFYIFSGIFVAVSLGALVLWGLPLGIDFTGGALVEISYAGEVPEKAAIEGVLAPLGIGASVRLSGENGFIIRMRELAKDERDEVAAALPAGANILRESSIGPLLGKEAAWKSLAAIALVLFAIVLFIWFAFRKVSKPVASWKYGLLVLVGLAHDITITAGVFAFLGHFVGVEIDTLFVTAVLVILGYSVHDKIVVFDRVRENVRTNEGREHFATVVGASISQTLVRSLNTSFTTLIALGALIVLGPASVFYFSLALIIGIVAGTYSSLCLSAPLLATIEGRETKS